MRLLSAVLTVLIVLQGSTPVSATTLPRPTHDVILRIDGRIQNANVGIEAHFDLPMLEALPRRTVTTANPWLANEAVYEGVLLRDLLEHVGAQGRLITIAALNDYSADMPVEDARTIDVILAWRRNGELMPVRGKGPLFVVFPFTSQPDLNTEERHAQSVWQVSRITVR